MLEEVLKKKNLKVTPQRMAILKQLNNDGHASIEEVYERVRSSYPSISLATIYKNLAAMQEMGIIKEIQLPNQKQKYELHMHPHIHLLCEKCGKIEDILVSHQELLRECAAQSRYRLKEASIAMMGTCPQCQ